MTSSTTGALSDGIVELRGDLSGSPYFSPDMAPVPRSGRRWGTKDMAALWISMSACVPTYQLASGMVSDKVGMNWWQAMLTILLGNIVVLVPMILNAHAGTKYGIPFPVYCRPSFGILGANVPALLRAFVACGWFGIQTWIGGWAIYKILTVFNPDWNNLPNWPSIGINSAQVGCFMFFWLINMLVIFNGIESIRILLNVKAPLLLTLGLALLAWAYYRANGFGPMLAKPSAFTTGGPKAGEFWKYFFPALTGVVGFWATLSLNIPDFSRYAYSQRDQALGQALGLPTTMVLFSFIGVAVTSATAVIYGAPEWDPVVVRRGARGQHHVPLSYSRRGFRPELLDETCNVRRQNSNLDTRRTTRQSKIQTKSKGANSIRNPSHTTNENYANSGGMGRLHHRHPVQMTSSWILGRKGNAVCAMIKSSH